MAANANKFTKFCMYYPFFTPFKLSNVLPQASQCEMEDAIIFRFYQQLINVQDARGLEQGRTKPISCELQKWQS